MSGILFLIFKTTNKKKRPEISKQTNKNAWKSIKFGWNFYLTNNRADGIDSKRKSLIEFVIYWFYEETWFDAHLKMNNTTTISISCIKCNFNEMAI